jgi:hypothetical protein
MTYRNYLYPSRSEIHSEDARAEADIVILAEELIDRIQEPPDAKGSRWVPDDVSCVLRMVGDHWGIYGAGTTVIETSPLLTATKSRPESYYLGPRNRPQILLDPAWLTETFEPAILGCHG